MGISENTANDQALYQLWDEFLVEWPESRLKTMSLSEYTGIGGQNTLCYWVEKRLEALGSIWGGSSFKFGVYRRADQTEKPDSKRYVFTDEYAWESKFGDTAFEALETVRGHILSVLSNLAAGKLWAIDDIPLWPVFKWKLAFLYQDRADPLLVGVYKAEHLAAFLDQAGITPQTPHSTFYNEVLKHRNGQDILAFSRQIWTKAESVLDQRAFTPTDAERLLRERYTSIGAGTTKIVGFLNEAGRTLALDREHKKVRLFMEPWAFSISGARVHRSYRADESRDHNLFAQAPNVARGHESIFVECSNPDAFEALLDQYDGLKAESPDTPVAMEQKIMTRKTPPLNQILFGPPGTGKTYHTVNKALEILDLPFYQQNQHDRTALHARFKALKAENRIAFVTFHQSFSYEDFVEGLKATTEDGQISYEVADGIFKRICIDSAPDIEKESSSTVDVKGRKIWKMSLGNTLGSDAYVYDKCIESDEIRLGYGENIDFSGCHSRQEIAKLFQQQGEELNPQDYRATAVDIFKNQMGKGDLVVISDGNSKFRAIGEINGDYECSPNPEFGHYGQTRKVIWHRVYEKSLSYERIMRKKFSQMTLYQLSLKTIDLAQLQALLGAKEGGEGGVVLAAGQRLGNGEHEVVSVSHELIRIRSTKTLSVIPFDRQMVDELVRLVREGKVSIDDIAKKRVFEKTNSNLEKFIVNGYPGPLSKLVNLIVQGTAVTPVDESTESRVLIIDEINRGNISSIFGELITLIEPGKRKGEEESLSVTLPYSKESFQVPRNLHLIGTMNTADRSLALMDTALRRRFDFIEMMPDADLLKDVTVKGINLAQMLRIMNQRIEALYDREHTLGHAFFLPVRELKAEEERFERLQVIFANKILPLLEEYFFEDWAKIRLVLNDHQKPEYQQFILEAREGLAMEELFGDGAEIPLEVEGRNSYDRNSSALNLPESYRRIYES
jgi:5-methylcytosine-specific restriction protein B